MTATADAAAIARALRNHVAVPDTRFDALFPTSQRMRSHHHWTPIDIALRVSALLAPRAGERVLDVGAGVGKVCLVGALTSSARWVGVEADLKMIKAAERAARQLAVDDRVELVHGDAHQLAWSEFDAIYMFNPFAEGLVRNVDALARREHYLASVSSAEGKLATMRSGARLVTYHGFGGEMPGGFELVHREPAREDHLCLWVRGAGA